MKVVVADTSPINYLPLIDCIDLLRLLYGRIIIPGEVFNELTAVGTPPQVTAWILTCPQWIEVRPVSFHHPLFAEADNPGLAAGEAAAIQLALAEPDSLLLIDDSAGRATASRLGVRHTGTTGVLVGAAQEGMVDLKASLTMLQKTNFRISQALIDRLLS